MKKNKNKIERDYSETKQTMTITVSGQFTFSSAQKFRQAYETEPMATDYYLDLAGVTKFDSAGLGCVLVMYEHIKLNNKLASLTVCNAPEYVLEIFECAKISHLLDDIQFDQNSPAMAWTQSRQYRKQWNNERLYIWNHFNT